MATSRELMNVLELAKDELATAVEALRAIQVMRGWEVGAMYIEEDKSDVADILSGALTDLEEVYFRTCASLDWERRRNQGGTQ